MDYKKYYSHFLKAQESKVYFTAHSHHFWPDVTREATLQYWDDAAKYVDNKWEYFFSKKIPQAQKLISKHLKIQKPEQIVFASNTHELVSRVLSALQIEKIKVLTTDSEFYSFTRQLKRLELENKVEVLVVSTEPFDSFEERFIDEIKNNKFDFIFLSHVFFNSGVVVENLNLIVDEVRKNQPESCQMMIDGYHGFMAVPTDLSLIADRAFYVSGSYKYAQGGEGACFLVVPENCQLRPVNTGWFAGFQDLTSSSQEQLTYPNDGMRFAGSTMDMTAIYRLIAVLELFDKENISVEVIHQHVQKLQTLFLEKIRLNQIPDIYIQQLIVNNMNHHGHFLAFDLGSNEKCVFVCEELKKKGIFTDYRKSILRFGFGLQHSPEDIQQI